MSSKPPVRPGPGANGIRPSGFYDNVFRAEELRWLNLHPQNSAEQDLLRIIVRRLARLTPLKELNDKELNALPKLARLIAVIDALERTEVLRRKGGFLDNPELEAFAANDVDDV